MSTPPSPDSTRTFVAYPNHKYPNVKIVLTGSLGRIGKPLTEILVGQGHTVTVISSNSARSGDIAALGATPAIGNLTDAEFLAGTFAGADLAYVMVPPANYFDQNLDLLSYFKGMGRSFAAAAQKSGVKKVINLSSIGAHLKEGNGILEGTYHVEQMLDALPAEVAITHIRPTEIYYNLFAFIEPIRHQGVIATNLAPETTNVWVAPRDIAAHVADEINRPAPGNRNVRYVASEEISCREVAITLGAAVGQPSLQWVEISDAEREKGLVTVGIQPAIARQMAEMYAAIRSGILYEHYRAHQPATLGDVKLQDFATTFAVVYRQSA